MWADRLGRAASWRVILFRTYGLRFVRELLYQNPVKAQALYRGGGDVEGEKCDSDYNGKSR